MREIVLDTETTGLDPATGHRLVEIGCVELIHSISSGKIFHKYLNPQRDVPADAYRVHGLSQEFLSDKPVFETIIDEFMAFIGDARLVIHNAEFDMRFINAELTRAGRPIISMERVLDTLALARRKHPGAPNSLDALCACYHIDNSRRTKHGALLDSEILAEVYVELTGGHQKALAFAEPVRRSTSARQNPAGVRKTGLVPQLTPEEAQNHAHFISEMGATAIWGDYIAVAADDPASPA